MIEVDMTAQAQQILDNIPKMRKALGLKQERVHGIRGLTDDHPLWSEDNGPTHQCGDCDAYWRYIPANTLFQGDGGSWSVRSYSWGQCCEGAMLNMIPLTPIDGIVHAVL
jgi:hypothetical protein